MATELLKNSASMSVAGAHSSLLARCGPLNADQAPLALGTYAELYNQYVQMLDVTFRIAGPAMNAVGGNPAFPGKIATYSFCFDNMANGAWAGVYPTYSMGSKPSESGSKWYSPIAGIAPTFISERYVISGFTVCEEEWLTFEDAGPNSLRIVGANANHVIPVLRANGFLSRSLNTKFEITTGVGSQKIETVTSWGVFVTTIALPVLNTYQAVLKNLADRIKATAFATDAQRQQAWTLIMSCSPDVTSFTLDKLEVLRDPEGNPIYLPPASVSIVRDAMMDSIINSYGALAASDRFKVVVKP